MAGELPHKPPVNRLTDTAFRTSGMFARRVGVRQSCCIQTMPTSHGRLDVTNAAVIRQSTSASVSDAGSNTE